MLTTAQQVLNSCSTPSPRGRRTARKRGCSGCTRPTPCHLASLANGTLRLPGSVRISSACDGKQLRAACTQARMLHTSLGCMEWTLASRRPYLEEVLTTLLDGMSDDTASVRDTALKACSKNTPQYLWKARSYKALGHFRATCRPPRLSSGTSALPTPPCSCRRWRRQAIWVGQKPPPLKQDRGFKETRFAVGKVLCSVRCCVSNSGATLLPA